MAKEIVVYSTPLCVPCQRLKDFLKEEGVKFKVKDLLTDQEAAELMDEKGIRSAPALGIDGKILFGSDLNPENIRKELKLQFCIHCTKKGGVTKIAINLAIDDCGRANKVFFIQVTIFILSELPFRGILDSSFYSTKISIPKPAARISQTAMSIRYFSSGKQIEGTIQTPYWYVAHHE